MQPLFSLVIPARAQREPGMTAVWQCRERFATRFPAYVVALTSSFVIARSVSDEAIRYYTENWIASLRSQ